MTKTPEQLAEEYADLCVSDDYYAPLKAGFLAGYEAAKDQLQPQPFHVGADVYVIDANNPLPKPMPLSIAEQVQFANTSKVMNSSNNSNGWISVKDRLPPDGAKVLLIVFGDIHYGWIDQSPSDPTEYCLYFSNTYIDKGHHALTHWMPIPSKPKYMSDYVEYEAPKEAK